MRTLLALAIAVCVHGALSVAAHATDQLVPGKIFIRRPAKLAKFIAKPISPATFALPAPANSPIAKPWELRFKVDFTWYHISSNTLAWKGLGNPPGSKGYKYKGDGTMADPCTAILVKPKIIKAACRGTDLPSPPYNASPVPIQVGATDNSDRYCAEFGGTEVKNDFHGLRRKDAPAPSSCASPSGAFVDDSSSVF